MPTPTALPCGCVPHSTRMSRFGTALYCETEQQPYCNFECPHEEVAMASPTEYEILLAIRASDPDGQATEPSDEDYNQFKAWVIATYGEAIWNRYTGSNWDEGSTE